MFLSAFWHDLSKGSEPDKLGLVKNLWDFNYSVGFVTFNKKSVRPKKRGWVA